MKKQQPIEQELPEALDVCGAHADEMAELFPHESKPLEKQKGSVKKVDQPTDPAADLEDWDAWFDKEERVSEDFLKDRGEIR